MNFGINNIGKILSTKEVQKTANIAGAESINSVFTGSSSNKYVPNTKFTGEEQHVLGLMAAFSQDPNNILLEE